MTLHDLLVFGLVCFCIFALFCSFFKNVIEDDVFIGKLPTFEKRCETPAGTVAEVNLSILSPNTLLLDWHALTIDLKIQLLSGFV